MAMCVRCSDNDIKCEQLQVVPSKIYILLYFFPLDEFEQELHFCFIIIRKFGVQTFQKWQVSNLMNFVLSFRVSDRACDEFVHRRKLENHFERNYFIRVRIESISKTFAVAEKKFI